ncbi:MAG TPA: hypothetical protein VIX15_17820 [Streptosporangiaceae bacterium]
MTGQVGPRGLAVLVLAGITGLLLAILGWSNRGTGLVAPSVGLGASAPAHTAPAHTTPAHTTPAHTATPTTQASATPAAGGTPSPGTAQATPAAQPSATASVGPWLGSEPYASFAYLVWPGTLSAASQAAMSGLTISVTRKAGGISVVAGVTGQQLPPARFYPGGAKVYVLESGLGDDSGNLDYNLGDDGLVVTDGQGDIVS